MKGYNYNTEVIKNSHVKHRQLSLEKREELAKYAIEHGINFTATLFGKHYNTIKRWHDRYLNGEILTNIETVPLTSADYKYLDSLSHLVGHESLHEIKLKFSLCHSIDTLAKYYKKQNIVTEQKHLLILKCSNCKLWLRAINVYFGRPRNIQCPFCGYHKLSRQEYLRIPFYNPRPQDYFFNRSLLTPINSNIFREAVLPLLKMPKDLKCLLVYNVKPRIHNRIHIIKYFERIGDNTIPVTYCSIGFPKINKREILNPRSQEIDTDLICQHCQIPYFRDFNKNSDKYPNIKVKSSDPMQIALELFYLAQKYNNKDACILMGISKKGYYKFKKQYADLYAAIQHLKNEIQ